MVSTKRVVIATIFGVIFGFVCWALAASGETPMTWFMSVSIILSRTLMGFAIGISALRMKWWLHGIILGFIFSLPMAFNSLYAPANATYIFIGTIVLGMVYGFLIELFTSKVFRAKAKT